MRLACFVDVRSVARQQIWIQGLASGALTGKPVKVGARTITVLIDSDLAVPKQFDKCRGIDAAMAIEVTIVIEHAFPRYHGSKMRRLKGGDLPLLDSEIRNAQQTYFSGRPGPSARPLDCVVI